MTSLKLIASKIKFQAENLGSNALRQVTPYLVTVDEWNSFLFRHSSIKCLVPENNEMMRNSYLLLDEYMRLLDSSGGRKDPSLSILDVGVKAAMDKSGFDENKFFKRGGKYKWSKGDTSLDW